MTTTASEATTTVLKKGPIEKVGEVYSTDQMFKVRGMTRAAIHKIAAQVKPGMVEEKAVEMAQDILAESGMIRGWHAVYVRFGTNTTKTFGADSDPGVVLGADDIFLIDVGPVFEKWEGDGGDTFLTGTDPDKARCAADARKLFHIVRKKWEAEQATGRRLYEFAVDEARRMGWELNMDLSGHRISEFPHEAHYPGPMADVDFTPSGGPVWVLEIHIRHPTKRFGAFYEDMLLDDSYFPDFKA
jgi:Xaa-Pro aminopeptidase